MNDIMMKRALHIPQEEQLKRSRWYGPNLVTFLTTSEETGGSFSLMKCTLRKGFEPPMHVHSREEESSVILSGEILYTIGDQVIHTRPGDYIHLPRAIPHRFELVTETATVLLLITPGGFEAIFQQFSRPAISLELPPLPTEMPGPSFFETMRRLNAELGVRFVEGR